MLGTRRLLSLNEEPRQAIHSAGPSTLFAMREC